VRATLHYKPSRLIYFASNVEGAGSIIRLLWRGHCHRRGARYGRGCDRQGQAKDLAQAA
jgi:hypothetical protein